MQGVMINERPAGGDMALKGNIGNYKGVMLCNRPSEAQEMKNQDRMINKKFISRVENIEQIGLNPIKKNYPPISKRSVIKEILVRHKKYIRELGKRKHYEKIEKQKELEEMMKRDTTIKKRASKARKTLTQIKKNVDEFGDNENEKNPNFNQTKEEEIVQKAHPLTEANIKQLDENNIHEENKSEEKPTEKHSKKKIPAWAKTEKMVEEEKEEEIDNLINFAYELDYEKYINDLEFKSALAILKERVNKIKEDENWREKYKENLNQIGNNNELEQQKLKATSNEKNDEEKRSHISEKSHKSHISKAKSIMSNAEVAKADIKEKLEDRPEWDKSTKEKNPVATLEDKVASQIADEILKSSNTFKKVHSKASVRRILEREAKKQLIDPKIVKIEEHKKLTNLDPSQLPYLHRNESV